MEEYISPLLILNCPSCGAPLHITKDHIDDDIIQCDYCKSKYQIHGQGKKIEKVDYIEESKEDEEKDTYFTANTTEWNSGVSSIFLIRGIIPIIVGLLILMTILPSIISQLNIYNSSYSSSISQGFDLFVPVMVVVIIIVTIIKRL